MGQGFVNLFLDTSAIAWIVLIASLACLIAEIFIPKFGFTTDNAAMIGIVGHYKYLDRDFCAMDQPAFTRTTL